MKQISYIFLALFFCVLGSATYNQTQSRRNAYYAAITHCPGKQIQSWTCKVCKNVSALTDVTYIDNPKTKIVGFAGYDKDSRTIIFSYRCTEQITNYFEDVSYLLIPYGKCKECLIHFGFLEAFKSIQNKVISIASKFLTLDPQAKILCVGHSLGGAMATITALQLQLKFSKVKQLHTFGAPRIGNAALATFLKQRLPNSFRIIHYRDLAPHLPFQANGYRHHPHEVLFDEQFKNYTVCDDSGQDIHCSNKYFPEYSGKYHMFYFIQLDDC